MPDNIVYERNGNYIECIYYKDSTQSYPVHTHAEHIVTGQVLQGTVRMICNGKTHLFHAGDWFCILPDVPHTVEAVDGAPYSMITLCICVENVCDENGVGTGYVRRLKQMILETPEKPFPIADMAQNIGVSPYHMIRRFKAVCGLTPHQFQIQCRIRRAQKMLDADKSVTEVAYATGFCDQSHFDRCFHRIVRLTPGEYKKSVKHSP